MTLLWILLAVAALLLFISKLPPLEKPDLDDPEFGGNDELAPDATEIDLNG